MAEFIPYGTPSVRFVAPDASESWIDADYVQNVIGGGMVELLNDDNWGKVVEVRLIAGEAIALTYGKNAVAMMNEETGRLLLLNERVLIPVTDYDWIAPEFSLRMYPRGTGNIIQLSMGIILL